MSSFNYLNMVSFSFFIVFTIASLKSLSAETNIWGHIETVSVDCFFSLSIFTHISQFLLNTGNLGRIFFFLEEFFFFGSNTVFFSLMIAVFVSLGRLVIYLLD